MIRPRHFYSLRSAEFFNGVRPGASASAAQLAACLLVVFLACSLVGCGGSRSSGPRRGPQSKQDSGGDMIKSLAESINRLEEFDSSPGESGMAPEIDRGGVAVSLNCDDGAARLLARGE